MASGPIRTCVACREKTSPDDLVRMVSAPDGSVVIDFRGKLPGRGAWAHPGCLAALEARPGGLKRSFKRDVKPNAWLEHYRSALQRALEDGLSLAAASGALVGGRVMLEAAIRDGEVTEVVVANDAAPRTLKGLREVASDEVLFTEVALDAATLGSRVGKGARAAVGVRSSRSATHLRRQLRRLRSLG